MKSSRILSLILFPSGAVFLVISLLSSFEDPIFAVISIIIGISMFALSATYAYDSGHSLLSGLSHADENETYETVTLDNKVFVGRDRKGNMVAFELKNEGLSYEEAGAYKVVEEDGKKRLEPYPSNPKTNEE